MWGPYQGVYRGKSGLMVRTWIRGGGFEQHSSQCVVIGLVSPRKPEPVQNVKLVVRAEQFLYLTHLFTLYRPTPYFRPDMDPLRKTYNYSYQASETPSRLFSFCDISPR